MVDGSDRVEFTDVYVVSNSRFVLMCLIGSLLVAVRPSTLLPGSEVKVKGDRGLLVLSREVAVSLGLA